ncbi:glycosyl transferase family 2 [Atlantibacter subterraneus]|uniref:glycosyl transferase family 2 n=1 Tax=Atlantibacter subterraneus TaxID=255519 RepID=UPI002964C2FE|nr:glycosyl transferase family 2 [Atlantibacter subterranea]MDW2741441.1 glycosyl transferase family 2 [Atlantibacter subterranea]
MKSESFVSVVLNTHILSDELTVKLRQIQEILDIHYSDYEILIVSKGPYRDVPRQSAVDQILKSIPSVRLLQLSGCVHDDVVWAAGLENAIGDFVVLYDYFTDPLEVIPRAVEECKAGYDVVVGVSNQPLPYAYRLLRDTASRILKAIDYHIPKNSTGLRCLSRRAVNAVTDTGRFHHQFYLRIQKTGYPVSELVYTPVSERQVKKSIIHGFRNLVRLMVFNSSRPLRWMSIVGTIGSLSALLFAIYSIVVNLLNGHVVEGWTTTILFMSVLFMLQFIMLAFFGEYLSRLLDDRSEQAAYSVVFEKNSVVMVNQDRVNVLNDATAEEANLVQTGRDR